MTLGILVLTALGLCVPAAARTAITAALAPVERAPYLPSSVAALAQSGLEQELARSDRFQLVERGRLEELLKETAFQQSGVTDPATAAELGRQLNVQLLLFAQVVRAGPDFRLTLRAVDVASARVVWVEEETLGRSDSTIRAGSRELARRVVAAAMALAPAAMVPLPAGTLSMGSSQGLPDEAPPHLVSLNALQLDATEVSQAAFDAHLQSRGLHPRRVAAPDLPATMVSWVEADEYCRAQGKRLPTEAEWEYAARGTAGRPYPWGEAAPSSSLARFGGLEPVAVDEPLGGATPEGLLHLAGNAAEWVQDWWDPGYYRASPEADPQGPASGDFRVVRGGSASQGVEELRAAARGYHNPLKGAGHIGFRCARSGSSP
ncbi:MAG: SUMF1/EgtB/PvdO family nonheme iron enzyme [Gemmatimonadota bacterium]